VLRLCQITGLAEAFGDSGFSSAWEVGTGSSADGELLSDVIEDYEADDKGRVFHTFDKWECYRAGFYAERPPKGMTQEEGETAYRDFLRDMRAFESTLESIIAEWKHSCEHYLTNDRMNRIAWLGQASLAKALGVPSGCRGGYQMLTDEQKYAADQMALKWLNVWLERQGKSHIMLPAAVGRTEAELY
jgi:hypothetical protein